MKLIQPLFASILLITILFIRTKKRTLNRIFPRVGFILFFLGFTLSLFQPEIVQSVADFLGVGRGTDLIIYFTTVGTLLLGILVFIKIKELEQKITKLARSISLNEINSK
jgi:hypothetical protein